MSAPAVVLTEIGSGVGHVHLADCEHARSACRPGSRLVVMGEAEARELLGEILLSCGCLAMPRRVEVGAKAHRLHAAPSTGTRVDIGGVSWRPEGGKLADRKAQACRLAFTWNMSEGIPTEALEAGVVADFYIAALNLADAVQGKAVGSFDDIATLAAKVRAAYDAHRFDTTDGRLHDCKACSEGP